MDSKGKHKSVLSLFKFPKEKPKVESAPPRVKKERREHQPPSNETIRIPLHSPKYYESKSLLQEVQTSSQDSQVTVVEVLPPPVKAPAAAAVQSLPEEVVADVTPSVFRGKQVYIVPVFLTRHSVQASNIFGVIKVVFNRGGGCGGGPAPRSG